MTNNITINSKNQTIELNATFAKKAQVYGTTEYDALQGARRDYPNYAVVTKKHVKKSDSKGLNYERMAEYIMSHENSEANIKLFDELKNIAPYFTVKKWFIKNYPSAIANADRINEIMNGKESA